MSIPNGKFSLIKFSEIDQIRPNSISALPPFTITGTNTGSAYITFAVSGCPDIRKNDLVGFPNGIDPLRTNHDEVIRVLKTTVDGTCVTDFTAVAWLANYVPNTPLSGPGQVVNLGDLSGKQRVDWSVLAKDRHATVLAD